MRFGLLSLTVLSFAVGCGGRGSFAPVSGRVTLDKKPLANAIVFFQPDKENPGPPSEGKTDSEGKYTLRVASKNVEGAQVGKHKVSISLTEGDPGATAGANPKPRTERLPAQYNSSTKLKFDVPSGGSSAANFDLESR
jgi:hypothetical protein